MRIRPVQLLPALALTLGMGTAASLSAKDITLLLTDVAAYPQGQQQTVETGHETLAAAYRKAGFEVFSLQTLDRDDAAAMIASFEAEIAGADRLVVHVNGVTASIGGVDLLVPSSETPETRTEAALEGLPLALLLDLAADKPTASAVVIGSAEGASLNEGIVQTSFAPEAPQGVLLITGPSLATGNLVLRDMLAGAKAATELGELPEGVVVSGLVSDDFRLNETPVVLRPTPTPTPSELTPEDIEDALALTRAQRVQVQRDLTVLGYDTRGVDGVFGPGTRSALRDWQAASNRPVTGFLNEQQLAGLTRRGDERRAALAEQAEARKAEDDAWARARDVNTVASYRRYLREFPEGRYVNRASTRIEEIEAEAASSEEIRAYRRQEDSLELTVASVAVLEQRLKDLGFDSGPADGKIDRRTRQALSGFQADAGLTPTGYFNSATVQRLIISGDG